MVKNPGYRPSLPATIPAIVAAKAEEPVPPPFEHAPVSTEETRGDQGPDLFDSNLDAPKFIQAQVEFSKSRTGGWPPFPMRPCQPGCRKDTRLHKHDQIRVPFASLDVTSSFTSELAGSLRHHAERFELHEKSARVRAETSGMADLFGGIPVYTPRHFHYDSPFFVFLWRDAEWPYFAAWVGDTSVLSPYPE